VDPGCLSRIRNFFNPGPGSRVNKIPGFGSAPKNLHILTQKIVDKLWILIFYSLRIPGSKRQRIPDPDPQHGKILIDIYDSTDSDRVARG
jgi:hypothetical protein